MYGFCSIVDIRNRNSKFENDSNISDNFLTTQITDAELIVIGDLSSLMTKTEVVAATGSEVLKFLTIYKTMEIALVNKFGFLREADRVTDVDYWMNKYKEYLKKILNGDIQIELDGTELSPSNIPVITSGVDKIFDKRGLDNLNPDYNS